MYCTPVQKVYCSTFVFEKCYSVAVDCDTRRGRPRVASWDVRLTLNVSLTSDVRLTSTHRGRGRGLRLTGAAADRLVDDLA